MGIPKILPMFSILKEDKEGHADSDFQTQILLYQWHKYYKTIYNDNIMYR